MSAKAEARFPSEKDSLCPPQSKLIFLKGQFIGSSEFQFPPAFSPLPAPPHPPPVTCELLPESDPRGGKNKGLLRPTGN